MLDPGPFQMISAIDFPQETGTPADILCNSVLTQSSGVWGIVLSNVPTTQGHCGDSFPWSQQTYTNGYWYARFRGTPSLAFTPTAATVVTGQTSGAVYNVSVGNPIQAVTSFADVCWRGGTSPGYTDDVIVKAGRLTTTGLCLIEIYAPYSTFPSPGFSLGETVTVLWS